MASLPDTDFEDVMIAAVSAESDGWSIKRSDGWSFFVPKSSPVEPQVGMTARFYGKGVGYGVRGLFLENHKVFYRTLAEDKEHGEIQMYGADAADWLSRWDGDRGVWSIEMGGFGPGYEQAIQITVAEVLRRCLDKQYDASKWADTEDWKRDREHIYQWGMENERIKALGLSGAQWGAAVNLAVRLYRDGPRKVLTDERVKNRKIQVRRTFPQVYA